MLLSDLTKLAVAVADVDRFSLKFNDLQCCRRISLKSDVVCQSYGTYTGLKLFRGHGVMMRV